MRYLFSPIVVAGSPGLGCSVKVLARRRGGTAREDGDAARRRRSRAAPRRSRSPTTSTRPRCGTGSPRSRATSPSCSRGRTDAWRPLSTGPNGLIAHPLQVGRCRAPSPASASHAVSRPPSASHSPASAPQRTPFIGHALPTSSLIGPPSAARSTRARVRSGAACYTGGQSAGSCRARQWPRTVGRSR